MNRYVMGYNSNWMHESYLCIIVNLNYLINLKSMFEIRDFIISWVEILNQ